MVKYLNYKGEKLPYRISYRAIKQLSGKDILEAAEGNFGPDHLEELCWGALRSGHKAEEKELKITKEDVEDILDEETNFMDFTKSIPEFFGKKALDLGKTPPNQVEEKEEALPADGRTTTSS